MIKIGVINISDRAAAGIYADEPGQACVALLREWLTTSFEPAYAIIPDEQPQIEAALKRLADEEKCALIVTTGGTGPAARDVTPEATRAVVVRLTPGLDEAMRAASLKVTPPGSCMLTIPSNNPRAMPKPKILKNKKKYPRRGRRKKNMIKGGTT